MVFDNEQTVEYFLRTKAEGRFHDSFEQAVEKVREEFGKKYPIIIDGKAVYSKSTFANRSPIDRRIVLGHYQSATQVHVKKAVQAAKRAFEKWKNTDYKERLKIFDRAADIISDRKFELAAWLSYENGKNRFEAIADIDEAIDFIRYYSNQIDQNNGFTFASRTVNNEKNTSIMKPYGVWAVIAPFNFPAAITIGMSVGALITGNTVVLKPASDTPGIGYKFMEIMQEAGLGDGVLNYVTGSGNIVGRALTSNLDIEGIVFTGSRDIGYDIARQVNKLKPRPVIAELGGKNPAIITENADLEKAVEGVIKAAFGYAGQKCSACSRIYVQKSIKNNFIEKLTQRTADLPVGNPIDPNIYMGPLINLDAYQKYKKYAKMAFRDGKVLVGGSVKNKGDLKNGYYVHPTVVDKLPKDHILFTEELFVPILCVSEFDNFEEALQLANDSAYGLTAGLYSEEKKEIDEFLRKIEAGVVYVNRGTSATTGAMVGCQSFGGWKGSGTTGKGTGGKYYLTQFMREQSQTIVE